MVGPWPSPPGTLRALRTILGHHYVLCHRCRRFADMMIPRGMEDRKYEPCPFRCRFCGERGALETEVPVGYQRGAAG